MINPKQIQPGAAGEVLTTTAAGQPPSWLDLYRFDDRLYHVVDWLFLASENIDISNNTYAVVFPLLQAAVNTQMGGSTPIAGATDFGLFGQTTQSENGIYYFNTSGQLVRKPGTFYLQNYIAINHRTLRLGKYIVPKNGPNKGALFSIYIESINPNNQVLGASGNVISLPAAMPSIWFPLPDGSYITPLHVKPELYLEDWSRDMVEYEFNFDFGLETDNVLQIQAKEQAGDIIESVTFIPVETAATSIDDFLLNGVTAILCNETSTQFTLIATALNGASGVYRFKVKIKYFSSI